METKSAVECPVPQVSRWQELVDNVPYGVMLVLGAVLFVYGVPWGPWGWGAGGAYIVYGVVGALWIMVFVCPYCHFYGTRLCPCGYGQIAVKLRAKRDGERFRQQFRRHIPVIVPLWILPLIAAGLALVRGFSWQAAALTGAFLIDAAVILPLVSRAYGCAKCPQKETCPWMGGCKKG
jgi:hypothetical protein